MIRLGISLYPEQESMEEIEQYLALASKYGFTQLFTSLFSVPGKPKEVITYFENLCTVANKYHFNVAIDVHTATLEAYGASYDNLKVFKDIGIDTVRMDLSFGDHRDITLVENEFGLKIQFNAFMADLLEENMRKVKDKSKVIMCYNFYPQRYTGTSVSQMKQVNQVWRHAQIRLAAFITSLSKEAHGPWPVKDGLPTLEKHRDLSVGKQIRELIALGIEDIYFGNAFAKESELKEASDVIQAMSEEKIMVDEKSLAAFKEVLPNLGNRKIMLELTSVAHDLTDIEKVIVYGFDKHVDLGDSNEFMLRSRVTRTYYGKKGIPFRKYDKDFFDAGDVVVVNDNLKHYAGELQIVRSEMKNDGQRNYVGKLSEFDQQLSTLIEPGDYFFFKE